MEVDPAKKGAVYDNVGYACIEKSEYFYIHGVYVCKNVPVYATNIRSCNSYTILKERSTENMGKGCEIDEIVGIWGRGVNKKLGGIKAKDSYKRHRE